MTRTTDDPAGLFDRPCIAAFTTEVQQFTVADYNSLQQQHYDQPLWVRRAPRVEAGPREAPRLTAAPPRLVRLSRARNRART